MTIRILEFNNNFCDPYIGETDTYENEGDYCTFGYYDEVSVSQPYTVDFSQKRSIWNITAKNAIEGLNRHHNKTSFLCFTDCSQEDKVFWESAEKAPFLFLSLARINEEWNANYWRKVHETVVDDLNNNIMIYFTNIHSELIIAIYGNGYTECKEKVVSILRRYGCLKLYSIFSVREHDLDHTDNITDETVRCRLRVSARDPKRINDFLVKLETVLDMKIDASWVLGRSDVVLDIPSISIKKILPLYKANELLTHVGYKDYFYNIETKFLIGGDVNEF